MFPTVVARARACPLCAGVGARRVWQEAGFAYLRCARCGLLFADISPNDYSSVGHNVWNEDDVGQAARDFYGDARARVHARFLVENPPTGAGRLLDVGCGLGYFLERARASGWSVAGSDTSAPWVAAAGKRLGGGTVRLGADPAALFEDMSFDLVTAWDVIEHVHDPVTFLRGLRRCLAPGGRVFIRTPNVAYVLPVYAARRALGHAVELGPSNHVVYFSAATLARALELAGLKPYGWRVFEPPQVMTSPAGAVRHPSRLNAALLLKNSWAAVTDAAARITRGRVVLGSDLDVFASARRA